MLKVTIPSIEQYDEEKNEFFSTKSYELQLEHSLISLSKWESKWKKPYLSNTEKTPEEAIDYIRCMTLNSGVDPECYQYLSPETIKEIEKYINDPMTATTFSKDKFGQKSREIITSEVIYYWMVAQNIPFECQKWHLKRLLTLINICSIKNQPPKKMSSKEVMSRNSALNAARRQAMNTRG